MVVRGRVAAASAVGKRKAGSSAQVTRDDRYVLMSVTKPMTSTLVGALVDAGKLHWNDTLEKMFPELRKHMQPAYRKVTILQLMSHTSGLRYTPSKTEPTEVAGDPKQALENRMTYVRNALADKPQAKPGTKYIYSGGHIIVAAYAERVMKKPYEALMEQLLFKRLHMTTASRWTNATPPDRVDGPWAHDRQGGRLRPFPPSPGKNCSRVSVAGVSCSMVDLGRWAAVHLHGARGEKTILSPATFKRLHTLMPPGQTTPSFDVAEVPWAKGRVLWHNGSNGTFFCVAHVVPEENYATCVACNYGGKGAAEACQEAHLLLVKHVKELKGKRAGKPKGR